MQALSHQIPVKLLQLLSAEQAHHYRILPVGVEDERLVLLTDHDRPEELLAELEIVLNRKLYVRREETEGINRLLAANYHKSSSERNAQQLSYTPDFLERILLHAKEIGSSDIHFEPYAERCRIRFRLDGKLREMYVIPIEDYPVLINKIKIRAYLDISEKRLPQDGRLTVSTDYDEFDIRVSTLPTLHGEKIVLRLLSRDADRVELSALGFSKEELELYLGAVRKPHGIILISGPTGSGKTTTLYATLKLLNDHQTNILTIEDPIEYTLEGVNQVQLKENIGMDFPSTLRTFLRQDPDIIMVGEIRDAQTANIAIRAALTGHLVLSTIHTNSAWATVSRLIDMGIPPFLVASTLNLSVAQRLIRKLCPICKQERMVELTDWPKSLIEKPENLKIIYEAIGCDSCHHTGYLGRKALYEIIPITEDFTEAIRSQQLQVKELLAQRGIKTLKENALNMLCTGITTLDEVYSILAN